MSNHALSEQQAFKLRFGEDFRANTVDLSDDVRSFCFEQIEQRRAIYSGHDEDKYGDPRRVWVREFIYMDGSVLRVLHDIVTEQVWTEVK